MARIDSGPVAATDSFADTPKSKWHFLLNAKATFLAVKINYDCRCLLQFCEEAEEVWQELGYESAEHMIRKGYGLDPVEIELAVAWLKHNEPQTQISLGEVSKRVRIQELREQYPDWTQQQIADEVGCSQQYVAKSITTEMFNLNKSVVIPGEIKSGRNKADFRKLPQELQEAVAEKRVSLNAAAIQAGIRKKLSPEEKAVEAFRKAKDQQQVLRQILEELSADEAAEFEEPLPQQRCKDEAAVKAFDHCDNRLNVLHLIVQRLEKHERAVVAEWLAAEE